MARVTGVDPENAWQGSRLAADSQTTAVGPRALQQPGVRAGETSVMHSSVSPAKAKIRLVLADDHPIVLDGLAQLFALERDCEVVARARDGDEALRALRQFEPDILVLDLRMPRKDGLGVLRDMRREGLSARVVLLTAMDNDDVVTAIRLGVRGIVLKDMASRLLVQCVRAVYAGGKWLEKAYATRAVEKLLRREAGMQDIMKSLTPREWEVAHLIAKGMHNKEIASQLGIGEGTTKLHLHNIYKKLNVDGRVGLMQYMQRNGLV